MQKKTLNSSQLITKTATEVTLWYSWGLPWGSSCCPVSWEIRASDICSHRFPWSLSSGSYPSRGWELNMKPLIPLIPLPQNILWIFRRIPTTGIGAAVVVTEHINRSQDKQLGIHSPNWIALRFVNISKKVWLFVVLFINSIHSTWQVAICLFQKHDTCIIQLSMV